MDKLEYLYEFAAETGIDILNRKFSGTKKAACLHMKPHKLIVLDKPAITSKCEEVAILSEEIGHYETGALYIIESTYNSSVARSNRIKYEAKARHWAYLQCCPPEAIESAIVQSGRSDHAIAEHCCVTVEFLHQAIAYHRSCGVVFSFDCVNSM